jgi:hypothetical protein
VWGNHFRWSGVALAGQTPVGRATVMVLAMNAPERVRLREALLLDGVLTFD